MSGHERARRARVLRLPTAGPQDTRPLADAFNGAINNTLKLGGYMYGGF